MNIQRLLRRAKAFRYDVIEINGQKFGVRWEYVAEVPEVRYFRDGSGQPGEPAETDVAALIDLNTLTPVECEDWTEEQWHPIENALFTIIQKEEDAYWKKFDEDHAAEIEHSKEA